MNESGETLFLSDWTEEFQTTLLSDNSLFIAIFSIEKELLFATPPIRLLFKGEPSGSFLNPKFDALLLMKSSGTLIFEGFVTIGDYSSVNSSIFAQIYRKENKLLVIGGIDTAKLTEQNVSMHEMNREIGNLQRQLLKEKYNLENALTLLSEANVNLKHLNATKDKFFSIIAHDLKNPFTSLIGFSDLLIKNSAKYKPEEVIEFATAMNNVSKRTYSLLGNLLEWARLQTGNLIPQMMKVIPSDIVDEVKLLCKPMADAKNISLSTDIEANDCILADKEMLKTILRNLVTNSLKFTFPGGLIEIKTHRDAENILFVISDTGIGIKPEFIKRIFDIDCELSAKGTAGENGTGLGLILCREFVDKHNGKIWVESEIGKGSEFKFTIPMSL
jgi:signal transduction histidine kinase